MGYVIRFDDGQYLNIADIGIYTLKLRGSFERATVFHDHGDGTKYIHPDATGQPESLSVSYSVIDDEGNHYGQINDMTGFAGPMKCKNFSDTYRGRYPFRATTEARAEEFLSWCTKYVDVELHVIKNQYLLLMN